MNLLIVDDDMLAVEGIERMLDKEKLGIKKIFTAYNIASAKEVIMDNDVDILLCDIEMPKGNGIELVEWINEQEYDMVCMFLTSHARFDYASKAVKMQVNDYILKPVPKNDLEKAILNAADTVKNKIKIRDNQKYANYWNSNLVKNNSDFWKSVLIENKMKNLDEIKEKAKQFGVSIEDDYRFFPILIYYDQSKNNDQPWETEIIEFIIKNIASEVLYGSIDSLLPVVIDKGRILVLYKVQDETKALFEEKTKIVVDICKQYYSFLTVVCYLDDIIQASNLTSSVNKIIQFEKNDLIKKSGVYLVSRKDIEETVYEKPNMDQWMRDILSDNYKNVVISIGRYLEKWISDNSIDYNGFNQFRHDFLQEMYIALKKKGIQAHSVFQNEKMVKAFDKAADSIVDMKNWISLLVDMLNNYSYEAESTPTVIEEVKAYIEEHLSEGITRTELATKVFLHPDYLSHIFKSKMNISISDYILEVRICEAKRLLLTTNDSIREIAMSVGCSNIAYFSKIFKKATGLTPKEFRKTKDNN